MLTVKHVSQGCEDIYCAHGGVTFFGSDAVLDNEAPGLGQGGPRLLIKSVDTDDVTEGRFLYRGVAYVMNEGGATIGVYRLGYAPDTLPSANAAWN
jgi:hypothetical protein